MLQLKSQQIASLVKFILGKKFSTLREKLQEKIPQILEITKIEDLIQTFWTFLMSALVLNIPDYEECHLLIISVFVLYQVTLA